MFLGSSDNMNGKISELHDMMPQLEGLKGTLYLDTYDELEATIPCTLLSRNKKNCEFIEKKLDIFREIKYSIRWL